MHYKTFVSMNIAIIGTGDTAVDYATAFACAGHEVYIASKDGNETVMRRIFELFDNIHPAGIEEAAEIADLIIIATEPKDVREVAYWLGDVRRKVIIDATANVPAPDEEFVKTAAGLQAITGSPYIVKVFNTKGYEALLKPIFRNTKAELILVGDSKKAKAIIKILAVELAIKNCYDFGGNEAIPLFNEMTKCWRNLAAKTSPVSYEKKALKS